MRIALVLNRFSAFTIFLTCASAQISITTEGYDRYRTSANLSETQLTTSNVNVSSFGKLWSYPVSGSVFAQPLYVRNVGIPGVGNRNVVYIATMNDVVYAFDADSSSSNPLWSVDLTAATPGATPVPITDIVGYDSGNIVGNVGIQGTPVIDQATDTIYLVARTKENGQYIQRLHALDITTGAETLGGPVAIAGSVAGNGTGSSGGRLVFDPKVHDQRAGLALTEGQVFIAWSSHEDLNNYHGWVMSYNEYNLQQTAAFCDTPNGSQGGIWMSGRAPAIDSSGNLFYMTGNGTWDGVTNFGESFLKLSPFGLGVIDWFTPGNFNSLNDLDDDLGASGPLILPGAYMVIGGGKQSIFYLNNNSNLGHENGSDSQVVQVLNLNGGEIKSGPVYWNRSGGTGPVMYIWADDADNLKSYPFNGSTFSPTPSSQSTFGSQAGKSGGVLAFSANGSNSGTGIVWSSMPLADDADFGVRAGVLRALNAENLTRELWNSTQNPSRDSPGNWPKFSRPLVASGRVYLGGYPSDGTGLTRVNVYGLLGTPTFTLSAAPSAVAVGRGSTAPAVVNVNPVSGFAGSVNLNVSGMPSGVTAFYVSGSYSVTVVFNASSSASLGTFPVTITGTSGGLSSSTTLALTVASSSCTPTPITPFIRINGTDWQQISNAAVPLGSNVRLGPQPIDGTWNWTGPNGFTGNSQEVGPVPLNSGTNSFVATYTNASSCQSTQTLVITVNSTPGFLLARSPSSLSVSRGSTATDAVSVTPLNGFSGAVTLSITGLPAGVTASVGSNPMTGSTTVTFTASTSAATGTTTVNIAGTSGGQTAGTYINLTVN